MQDIVIDISTEGVVKGMHRDEFNLGFLGRQKINRASEIKFNDRSQKWEILVPVEYGPHMTPVTPEYELVAECGYFDSYNTAREFEVRWMNECRIAGVPPGEYAGRRIASLLRDRFDKEARIRADVEYLKRAIPPTG